MTNFLHLVRDQINKIYPKRKKKNIIKERYREWLCRNFNNMHIRFKKKKKAKTISLGKNISKHVCVCKIPRGILQRRSKFKCRKNYERITCTHAVISFLRKVTALIILLLFCSSWSLFLICFS